LSFLLIEYFAIVYEISAVGCTIPLLAPIIETSPFIGKTIGGQGFLLGAFLTGHRKNTSLTNQ
jgi:hypothetical protein